MTKSWRPEGWENPYDMTVTDTRYEPLFRQRKETYEEGADAMLAALSEDSHSIHLTQGGAEWGYDPIMSPYDDERAGTWVFIPDDVES